MCVGFDVYVGVDVNMIIVIDYVADGVVVDDVDDVDVCYVDVVDVAVVVVFVDVDID